MEQIEFTWTKGHIIITPPDQKYPEAPVRFSFPIEIDSTYVGKKWKFSEPMIYVDMDLSEHSEYIIDMKLEAIKIAKNKLMEMNKIQYEN